MYYPAVLTYHRVGERRRDHVPTVSARAFHHQLQWLVRFRCRVLSLKEIVERMAGRVGMPPRSAAITFDDGYEETYTVAWPLLRRFGFPAIVFVSPAEVGLPGFATWDQLAQMAGDGMLIGSHTMRHRYLPEAQDSELVEELVESKRVIEERLGKRVDFLSYPIGGYTPQAQAIAKQAGYLAACTTNRAVSRREIDQFALRRVKVTERDRHALLFFAKLSGYYDLFRRLKPPQ